MKVHVCTTFSPEGYETYGKRFVESFQKYAPDTRLICYHESQDEVLFGENLVWRNLDEDTQRRDFISKHGSDPIKVSNALHPNHQSIRFCHKVFAVTDAAAGCAADWLVWMDADVVLHGKPDWEECLPEGKSLSFLARPHYPYTECGFVGYRVRENSVRGILRDMRLYYTSGEIFTRPQADWHDSRCFDICRERSDVPRERWHALAPVSRFTHVWPLSPLQKWCSHQKGPMRKLKAYGRIAP